MKNARLQARVFARWFAWLDGLPIKGQLADPGIPNTTLTGFWDFTSKLDDR